MTAPHPVPYLGPDRRRRPGAGQPDRRVSSAEPVRVHGGRLLSVLAVAVIAALVLPRLAAPVASDATLTGVRTGLAALGTALLVAAGLGYLLRWKLTGEAPVALVGVAMLVHGSVGGVFVPMAPGLAGDGVSVLGSRGLVRVLTSMVVTYLLVRSLSTPVVDSRLRPLRAYVSSALGLVLLFAAMAVAAPELPQSAVSPLYVALAVGWGAASAAFVRRAASRLDGHALWLGLGSACFAVSNVVRAAALGDDAGVMLSATAVALVGSGVVLFGAGRQVTELLGALGGERLRLSGDLADREQEEQAQQARREERLHDVRSTLAALRCAAGTLHRYDGALASTDRATLQTAVSAELVRLERLIDPADVDRPRPFGLAEALHGVLATERALGSEITVNLRGVQVLGRPNDTAAIVQNLLVNARRYAPGSPVSIQAHARRGQVEVRVEDRGPGLAPEEREAVFDRGHRGSAAGAASGSGLGLYVSRRLATEQGGDLLVADRRGGGASFVLRLPRVPAQQHEPAAPSHRLAG